ncbi:hypothetical protein CXG81DRAFT_28747 [Caulochytrium protostelioides]|uniref:Transmembrane protein n=1 Tax=Caulochytrium protostelioides TaxID=1555241 RepID=A0A4P9X274_9FUNG|nr:hypothetical protein CXG81DRAFT_28747 [Caulochytrium protostelioides]|eukprot:RKO98420.1 hypothetical protein CXG81DRAFT_28747 [Caulochytrium protostelioides]
MLFPWLTTLVALWAFLAVRLAQAETVALAEEHVAFLGEGSTFHKGNPALEHVANTVSMHLRTQPDVKDALFTPEVRATLAEMDPASAKAHADAYHAAMTSPAAVRVAILTLRNECMNRVQGLTSYDDWTSADDAATIAAVHLLVEHNVRSMVVQPAGLALERQLAGASTSTSTDVTTAPDHGRRLVRRSLRSGLSSLMSNVKGFFITVWRTIKQVVLFQPTGPLSSSTAKVLSVLFAVLVVAVAIRILYLIAVPTRRVHVTVDHRRIHHI